MADAGAADADRKRALEVAPTGAACFVCGQEEVKYRCPRCERITCSLACCLAHKKQLDCDGKRDRTKYIATKQFTDADLSSDYFFLEEVSRSTSSATRSRSQMGINVRQYGQRKSPAPGAAKKRRVASGASVNAVNPDVPSDWLLRFPVATQLLAEHSANRGVALTLLAPGMSKRVRNSSYMDTKTSTLYWRVEWDFPFADVAPDLVEERAADSQTIFELLGQYLTQKPETVTIRSKLKRYAVPSWESNVVLLLRKEFAPASQPQYYRLDGNLSLESNLKRKAVVEFPIITVVPLSEANQYPVALDVIEVLESHQEDGTDKLDDIPDATCATDEEGAVLSGGAEVRASPEAIAKTLDCGDPDARAMAAATNDAELAAL